MIARTALRSLLMLAWIASASAQPAAPDEVATLIARLGHASYAVRQAADRRLSELGEAARAPLEAAVDHADLETRHRVRAILRRISRPATLPELWSVRSARRRQGAPAAPPGASPEATRAIAAGLAYLVEHQPRREPWTRCAVPGCDAPVTTSDGDMTVTSLVLLALLADSHTHRHGRYKDAVKGGLRTLMTAQVATGQIGPTQGRPGRGHAVATLALVEAYGMTSSPLVRGAASKALERLMRQQRADGGWGVDGTGDLATTRWALLALRAAQGARLQINLEQRLEPAIVRGWRWVQGRINDRGLAGSRARPAAGALVANAPRPAGALRHAPTHAPTAQAMVCRALCQGARASGPNRQAAALLLRQLPSWRTAGAGGPSRIDLAYWLSGTQAAFQTGGETWRRWRSAVHSALLPTQRSDGHAAGSWDPVGAWGAAGRGHATALAVLTLQTPYRYPRFDGRPR